MSDVTVSANVDTFLQAANFAAMQTALGITDVGSGAIITSSERTKLTGIEASADVTDATNVTAAGALMDSEVTNLAQVKAFSSADYVQVTGTQSIGGAKTFSSNAVFSADLTVDGAGPCLHVDSTNDNVGIGTTSPNSSYKLDVQNGDANFNGYVYATNLAVGFNATVNGYLACSTFRDGGGSSQWGSESGGTFTFNGGVNIGGQAEASSQAASTDNSLMTRNLVDTDRWLNSARLWNPLVIPSFTKTGTGSVSQTSAGDAWVVLQSGTSNSGYGKAVIGRGLNSAPGLSGAGIYFSKPIGLSCNISKFAANDESNRIRIIVGTGTGAPAASGDDPISDDGFGVEIKRNATHTQWRVFAHNGTTLTATTFANLYSGTRLQPQTLAIYSNASGTITAYYGNYGADSFSTITTTGGPTGTGASATSRAAIEVANSSSGTATSKANVYSCKIYTPDN